MAVENHEENSPVVADEKATPSNEELPRASTNDEVVAAPAEKQDVERQHHVSNPERMTFRKLMALVAMAFLWVASQAVAYLYGGIPPYIYGDIGGADRWTWFVLGYLFALGAVCPFVGSLSDLFGRRLVALFGALLLMIGSIVTAKANSMNIFIGGMSIAGAGAGLCELTALAVTSELAPTRKRGLYVSILIFTIIPFCPSVLWAQLIAAHGSWRWCGLVTGILAFIGFALTLIFYFPPPRAVSVGLSRGEIARRIDYVGGFLSIAGLLLFTAGIQWGGYQYPWKSAHVLAPLLIGIFLFFLFCLYEWKVAKYPMFPRAIFTREPRLIALTLWITFVSGMNFFALILFWPTQSYNIADHDPLKVGIRNLALGFPILAGACIILALLSFTKGKIRELMLISCIFMTAGTGAMAAVSKDRVYISIAFLIIGGLGVGGIVVPASIITTIICPDELIATVTALTLTIRVLGGAIGYAIYYNVFVEHFKTNAIIEIGKAAVKNDINDFEAITAIIQLTGAGLLDNIRKIPGVTDASWKELVDAGRKAYSKSYPYVYYVSIAFGVVTIIACLFLKNIDHYMTDHVAVNYNRDSSTEEIHTAKDKDATVYT